MRPYLLRFATIVTPPAEATAARYDDNRQISLVDDDAPAALSGLPMLTKKCDRERGEDKKDRWC